AVQTCSLPISRGCGLSRLALSCLVRLRSGPSSLRGRWVCHLDTLRRPGPRFHCFGLCCLLSASWSGRPRGGTPLGTLARLGAKRGIVGRVAGSGGIPPERRVPVDPFPLVLSPHVKQKFSEWLPAQVNLAAEYGRRRCGYARSTGVCLATHDRCVRARRRPGRAKAVAHQPR